MNSGAAEDEKKLEDTKEVVKSRQSKKNRHYHAHKKKKGQKTMIHLILLRKLKIDQQEPHYKPRLNPSVLEGKSIPDLLTAPIV